MIRPGNNSLNVHLYSEPVDMRKQMDGLAALAEQAIEANPFGKNLFVFVNKKRDKLKMLYWEKNGFVVWYKRLEQERFKWLQGGENQTITVRELNWLLDGYDIFNSRPHQPMKIAHAT